MSIQDNFKSIQENIEIACNRSQRDATEIKLVAVSKTVGIPEIEQAVSAGVRIIGENRVQEAWRKFQSIGSDVQWHMVGHLQTNKVARTLKFADVIESVDSYRLAKEINRRAQSPENKVEIYIQVNTSGEESKYGILPEDTIEFIERISQFSNLNITGLMTIGLFTDEIERVRPCFIKLRKLSEQINNARINEVRITNLSMGMTNDYMVAIEEGATHIRIGRALFGERKY